MYKRQEQIFTGRKFSLKSADQNNIKEYELSIYTPNTSENLIFNDSISTPLSSNLGEILIFNEVDNDAFSLVAIDNFATANGPDFLGSAIGIDTEATEDLNIVISPTNGGTNVSNDSNFINFTFDESIFL